MMNKTYKHLFSLTVLLYGLWLGMAQAASIEIGQKSLENGIDVKAVYLQSIQMNMSGSMMGMGMAMMDGASCNEHTFMDMPAMQMSPAADSMTSEQMPDMTISGPKMDMPAQMPNAMDMMNQIHLSTHIQANDKNVHAFKKGDYIPYLKACYVVKKHDSMYKNQGHLIAMISSDGPHYGSNVQLSGPGRYTITFFISQPQGFHRHTDKETGIPDWWKPFFVQWDFTFVGTGKKGSY